MTDTLIASTTVNASPETVFAILADPSTHQAIDGTGWVRESLDGTPIDAVHQTFHVAMFHENHPDGRYEMANLVTVFDAPRAIAWKPGQEEGGDASFGGWIWRYDLSPTADGTDVTLTYDWSDVPTELREHIGFPPFPPSHLDNSLRNLAGLAAG